VRSGLLDSLQEVSASVRNMSGVLRKGTPRGAAEAVCVSVYMYTCMCLSMYVFVCMYVYTYVCMYGCMDACI
jgi:hypothetical protein